MEKEVKKVYFVENESVISDTMLKAIEGSYYNICREDRAIINKIYSQDKGVKVFRFVTFNYTKCIDKCVEILKNFIKDNSSYKIKPTLHIHGYIEENMIVGVNDSTQIDNISFSKDEAVIQEMPYIADYGKSIGQMFGGIENNSYDLPKVNTIGSGKGIAAISTVKGIDIPSIVDKPSTSSIIDFEQDDDSIKSISKRKPLTIKL